jgi:hypothetical protein
MKILAILAVFFLLLSTNAFAGKPTPPTDPSDYDAIFNCPVTVAVGEPLIINVNVVNNGPGDPGALIHIVAGDFIGGGTIVATDVVYDVIDKNKQYYTTYTYDLGSFDNPYSAGVYMDCELHLFDEDDSDSYREEKYCTFQIVE